MDIRLFLSKIIMLIYRSRELGIDSYDSLIETSLHSMRVTNKDDGFLSENMTKKMMEFIFELLEKHEPINLDSLLLSLEVMLENDPKLFNIISRSLSKELEEKEIKSVVRSLCGEIAVYNKEQQLLSIINRMSYDTKFNKMNIGDVFKYVREAIGEMEPLTTGAIGEKDPAIVREVRFGNKDEIESVFKDVRKQVNMEAVYMTGWQGLNRMTQGGLRPGEAVGVGALQHKYKTGSTLSMFLQLLRYNKPILRPEDEGKKPLAIRISLEDALENNFQFAYQYLKANDGQVMKPKEIEAIDVGEMAEYVNEELTKTGFEVIMIRVNPTEWGFAELFNYILSLEAEGYTIRICMIDYLLMLQTTGCNQAGHGVDKRDLLRRVRNFFSARGTLFVTPLQLSSEAMDKLRNGVSDGRFLKEIAGMNYTADSKQLSQEFDLELYCHLAWANNIKFLCLGRGKHRLPTEIEKEEWKFCYYPFPGPNIPVLEDVKGDDQALYSLPRAGGGSFGNNTSDAMLDEILG